MAGIPDGSLPGFSRAAETPTSRATEFMTAATIGAYSYPAVRTSSRPETPTAQMLASHLGEDAQIVSVSFLQTPERHLTPQVTGHLYIAGSSFRPVSLTEIPAHIVVIPQPREDNGGEILGVAEAYRGLANSTAQNLSDAHRAGLNGALDAYGRRRVQQPDGSFYSGQVIVAPTGVADAGIPRVFLHSASVPDAALHKTGGAAQETRIAHVENVMQKIFAQIPRLVASGTVHVPTAETPLVLAMPAICAGPSGAVSHQECASVLMRQLAKFHETNPELRHLEVVFALFNRYADDDGFAKVGKEVRDIVSGDRDALGRLQLPSSDSANVLFQRIIHSFNEPVQGGVTVTQNTLETRYGEWLQKFAQRINAIDNNLFNIRHFGRSKFSTIEERECFNQLHKTAQLPSMDDTASLLKPRTVTKTDIARLLADPDLKKAALSRVMNQLRLMKVQNQFAGDDKMVQIIATAVAAVLEERRRNHLEELEEKMEIEIEDLRNHVDAISGELRLRHDEVEDLRKKLYAQEDLLSEAQERIATEVRSRKAAEGQMESLKARISELTDDLRRLGSQVSAQQSVAQQYTSRTNPRSTWGSRYSSGESNSYSPHKSGE